MNFIELKINLNSPTFRDERNERVQAMLSEDSIRKRHRATTIGIHITFASWLLEFVSNAVILLLAWFGIQNGAFKFLLLVMDTSCCFILVPASYVLSTEKFKRYLNSVVWYMTFIDKFRSNAGEPSPNEEMERGALPRLAHKSGDDYKSNFAVSNRASKHLKTKSVPQAW